MELKKYLEYKHILVPLAFSPVFIVFLILKELSYTLFRNMVWFSDSNHYFYMSYGFSSETYLPFKARTLVPTLIGFLRKILSPLNPIINFGDSAVLFFWYNSFVMILVSIVLFLIFREYVDDNWAIAGVWLHNISFPVVWYFYSALTDTTGYLFLIIAIYLIKKDRNDFWIFITIFIGMFARESVLVVVPFWLYSKSKSTDSNTKYSLTDTRLRYVFLAYISIMFIMFYEFGQHHNVIHLPVSNWWFITLLCIIPFIPMVFMWKMSKPDMVFSISVLLFSAYALFFVFFDGRFLVIGYPIWVAYNLQVVRKFVDWAINEKELMSRSFKMMEHG